MICLQQQLIKTLRAMPPPRTTPSPVIVSTLNSAPSSHSNAYAMPATSSGGYGSAQNSWSDRAQRGRTDSSDTGLVNENEVRNAKQGVDVDTRRDFQEQQGPNWGLNPYGAGPDSREDAKEMLASAYRDRRGEVYESGSAAANDGDVGA